MPFSPLPEILVERLHGLANLAGPLAYDLGCGAGDLGRLIAAQGVPVVGLDRTAPWAGAAPEVVGDALEPPFLSGRADLVVVGNLFRHLLGGDPTAGFLTSWVRLLKPGGWLVLLEDEPGQQPKARKNYTDLQEFLQTLAQGKRRRLLTLAEFKGLAAAGPAGGGWRWGLKPNDWPADPEAAARMLQGSGPTPTGEVGRLLESIRKNGLAYGEYWWAIWEREPGV